MGVTGPTLNVRVIEVLVNRSFDVDCSEKTVNDQCLNTHTHINLYIYIWMVYFRTI